MLISRVYTFILIKTVRGATGLMSRLTLWKLKISVQQLKERHGAKPPQLPFSEPLVEIFGESIL